MSSDSSSSSSSFYDSTTYDVDTGQTQPQQQQIATEEQTISAYFVLFSALLAVVLVFSRLLHDHPRIAAFVPEAGMILITGVIFGAIIDLFVVGSSSSSSSPTYTNGGNDNGNDDGAIDGGDGNASSAGGEEEWVAVSLLNFSPAVFFLVLLPPIIFNSGYHLRKELFFRHLTPICLFAVVGTLVSALVIALLLQLVCQNVLPKESTSFIPTFTELLTFGALLSATDPVSTLAVFQVKRVDPQLFYLVFGESVLNDAVSLVLFNAFKDFVHKDNGAGKVAVGMSEFILGFLYDSVGSPALGLLFGLATAWLFKKIDFRPTRLLELSLFILIMYVPFLLAELLALSGIVTILFSGLAAKAYVVPNLSAATAENADVLIRLASHLAETAIFLELGLSVFGLKGSIHVAFIMWTIVACLIARAANVYPITFLYNQSLGRQGCCSNRNNHILDLVALPPPPAPDHASNSSVDVQDVENRTAPRPGEYAPQRPPALELTNLPLPTSAEQALHNHGSQPQNPTEKKESYPFDTTASATDSTNKPAAARATGNDDLRIAPNTAHMVWFSGLRGAVAYACVRSFPDTFGHADEFTMTTMIVVLVSVFGLGSTTECMLNLLQIRMNVDEDSISLDRHAATHGSSATWIHQWEDFLYRRVVRGGNVGDSFNHMAIRDSDANHGDNERSVSPVRTLDVDNSSGDLQLTPSAEFHSHTDVIADPTGNNNTGTTTTRLSTDRFSDDDEDDDEDPSTPGATRGARQQMPLQRKESVFDYGSSRSH